MSALSAFRSQREALAVTLGDALQVTCHPSVPDAIDPPCVVLQPGDDYIGATDTFGNEYLLTLEAFVLVGLESAETAADELDALLSLFLPAVNAAGWWVARMGAPDVLETSGWAAYGVALTIQTYTTL